MNTGSTPGKEGDGVGRQPSHPLRLGGGGVGVQKRAGLCPRRPGPGPGPYHPTGLGVLTGRSPTTDPNHLWEGVRASCKDPHRSREEEKPASLISLGAKRSAPGAGAGSQEGAQNRSIKANQPIGAAARQGCQAAAEGMIRPRPAGRGGGMGARAASLARAPSRGKRTPGNYPTETEHTRVAK